MDLTGVLTNTVYCGLFLVALIAFALFWGQEKLLFIPTLDFKTKTPADNPKGFRTPREQDMDYEDIYLFTKDGVRIHAWFIKQEKPAEHPTLVYFHANAGNMGFRMPFLKDLHENLKVNIIILSYRGYGYSSGKPSETGLYEDARCLFEHIESRNDIDLTRIFIFGRSLGGAMSIFSARTLEFNRIKLRGIILENTFTSIPDMVDALFSKIAFLKGLVLRLNFPSIDRIRGLRYPILFIAGDNDEIVPHAQMKRLYKTAENLIASKLWVVPGGMHNDTYYKQPTKYLEEVDTFIKECLQRDFIKPGWIETEAPTPVQEKKDL